MRLPVEFATQRGAGEPGKGVVPGWKPPEPAADAPLILVVEDDSDAQQVAQAMIAMLGYRTIVAGSGKDALRALKSELPAAILLDLHLPGLDGLGFLDTARRDVSGFDSVPVLATSGVYRDEAGIEGPLRRRKVAWFLRKPFSSTQLADALRRARGGETGLAEPVAVVKAPPVPGSAGVGRTGATPPPTGSWPRMEAPALPARAPAPRTTPAAPAPAASAPAASPRSASPRASSTPAAALPVRERPPPPATERRQERRLDCWFGAVAFAGRESTHVVVTEIDNRGLRVVAETTRLDVADEVRIRAQVEIPGRAKGRLRELQLLATVLWRDVKTDKVLLGLRINAAAPPETLLELLGALAKKQKVAR